MMDQASESIQRAEAAARAIAALDSVCGDFAETLADLAKRRRPIGHQSKRSSTDIEDQLTVTVATAGFVTMVASSQRLLVLNTYTPTANPI
jgi:hypothetical protein